MLRRPWFVLASVVVFAPVLSTCAQLPHANGIRLIPTDTGTTFRGVRVNKECPQGTHDGSVPPHMADFDDCQRLAIGASHFSSLIGVRALARTTTGDLTPFDQPNGVAVAQLYNFSSFEFSPLRIQPKYNCVYLRRVNDDDWQGRIVATGESTTCPAPTNETWARQRIPARRDSVLSGNPADLPAVARWEWTASVGNGAIGVHCGAGWCEIGRGLGASRNPMRGWGDEQLLAVDGPDGILVPRVHATITPATRLDMLTDRHFLCPGACTDSTASWVHVATVTLTAPSPEYKRKMNFDEGRGGNRIYIRYKPSHPDSASRWQTRIISAGGDTSFHVTRVVPQPGGMVPPVARFHWKSDDDTTWVRCSLGCCESSETRLTAL